MKHLFTTLGLKSADEMGMILPHEHVFTDLGPIEEASYRFALEEDVIAIMAPQIEAIKARNVTALIECTPVGVGRRADINLAVSEATNFPIVVPTGIYREPWVPTWAQKATQEELRDWMLDELTGEIDESGVQAGWIKLSASDKGVSKIETKILRAAAQAGASTGAIIGSHSISGNVVNNQLDIVEEEGYTPDRFIWIHTQAEPKFEKHLQMAARGAWLEYDSIGDDSIGDDYYIELIRKVLDAGYGDKLLLSQDRGWYDPSKPAGGDPKSYTVLSEHFLPKLEEAGIEKKTIRQITHDNPFRAFAR